MGDLESVKNIIIALVNMYPKGLAADMLNREYRKEEGHGVPFGKFGFRNLLTFITSELATNIRVDHSLATNEVILYPIASAKSAHIVQMKMEEKNQNKNQFNNPSAHRNVPRHPDFEEIPSKSDGLLPTPPMFQHIVNNGQQLQAMQNNLLNNFKRSLQNQNLLYRYDKPVNREPPTQHDNQVKRQASPEQQSAPIAPDALKSEHSMTRHQYLAKMAGQSIKYRSNEWDDVLADASEAVIIYADAKMPEVKEPEKEKPEEKSNDTDTQAIAGIAVAKSIDLNSSMDGFLDNCVSDTQNSHSSIDAICELMDKALFNPDGDFDDLPTELWRELRPGMRLDCTLSEVNNPLKFWVQLKKFEGESISLRNNMLNVYGFGNKGLVLKVPTDDIEQDELYAHEYRGDWYRVRVEKKLAGDLVQVRFVDYGSRLDIEASKLCHLLPKFRKTPVLAVCCALANIRPIDVAFSVDSSEQLIKMTEEKDLTATVMRVDEVKSKVMVDLMVKSIKLNVNQEMIRTGLAKYRPPVREFVF